MSTQLIISSSFPPHRADPVDGRAQRDRLEPPSCVENTKAVFAPGMLCLVLHFNSNCKLLGAKTVREITKAIKIVP